MMPRFAEASIPSPRARVAAQLSEKFCAGPLAPCRQQFVLPYSPKRGERAGLPDHRLGPRGLVQSFSRRPGGNRRARDSQCSGGTNLRWLANG